jgi:CrcB protein
VSDEIDPDVDLHIEAQRKELSAQVLAVIAVGGGLGALARYGLTLVVAAGEFPWATFVTNVTGCFLIGVLMVLVAGAHRLVRPFLGVGVLGGFTTFSTYAVEFNSLLRMGQHGTALLYLFGTLLSALVAVLIGVTGTRALVRS